MQKICLNSFDLVRADALLKKEFPPLEWAIENLLPSGLAILAGPPKVGKSWMALDLCYSVGSGKPFLGHFPVNTKPTVYFGLEDSFRRLQSRFKSIIDDNYRTGFIYFLDKLHSIDKGIYSTLTDIISKIKPGVIVIDTFAKISPSDSRGNKDYINDYKTLGPLQKFASDNNTTIILVHHTRKMPATNEFDEISGTTAITGVADTLMLLKKTVKDRGKLSVVGRDIEANQYELEFSGGKWSYLGASLSPEEVQNKVIGKILSLREKGVTQSEIADEVGTSQSKVSRILKEHTPRDVA